MRERERESTSLSLAETPSLDLVFGLLSNRHRRYVLYYLQSQTDDVATIDELAHHVLTLDEDLEPSVDNRRQVVMSLQHTHLPKLEDIGVVEHDARSETVRYWTQPSLEELLDHARYKELPDGQY